MKEKTKIIWFALIGIFAFASFMVMFVSRKGMEIVGKEIAESLPPEVVDTTTEKFTLTKEARAYKYIEEIFGLLNNRDYEKVYDLLQDDYKAYAFNNSYEIFRQYMAGYVGNNNYQPKFKDFYYKNKKFVILTEFLKSSYTKQDLLDKKSSYLDTIVIEEYAENDFKFAFGGFISSSELSSNAIVSNNITVTPNRLTYLKEIGNIEFSIKNGTENPIIISGINCVAQTNYYGNVNLSCAPTYNVPAGETITVKAAFPYSYSGSSYVKYLIIKDISLRDKKIKITVPLT